MSGLIKPLGRFAPPLADPRKRLSDLREPARGPSDSVKLEAVPVFVDIVAAPIWQQILEPNPLRRALLLAIQNDNGNTILLFDEGPLKRITISVAEFDRLKIRGTSLGILPSTLFEFVHVPMNAISLITNTGGTFSACFWEGF